MTLHDIGVKHKTDKASFHNYCNFYEANLDTSKIANVLEVGIKDGASLKMWRDWLPFSDIVGIDIEKPMAIKNVQTFLLDGTKKETAGFFGSFDLIIDDGSHMTADQIKTFKLFWGKCNYAYILEDIHTSFRTQYVNSKITAYDYIHQFIKENNIKFVEFWNVEDKSESGTIILFK
jgi:hypothetical protein